MKSRTKIRARASGPSRSSMVQHHLTLSALDTLPIGVVLLDSRLRIVSVNAEAARLLGHAADVCLSKPLQEVMRQGPGASGHNITTRIQEALLDRRPIHATYATLTGSTHESYPVEWTYVSMGTDGAACGLLTIRVRSTVCIPSRPRA